MSGTATTFGLDTTRIVFGAGASEETGEHVAQLGIARALVVCDPFVSASGLVEQEGELTQDVLEHAWTALHDQGPARPTTTPLKGKKP